MRVDETNDAFTSLFDIMLGQTNELHIVIIQPFGITFVQGMLPTWFFFIILHQRHNPLAFVLAFSTVRRITYNNHHRAVTLDSIGLCGFATKPTCKEGAGLIVAFFKRIGQVNFQTFL